MSQLIPATMSAGAGAGAMAAAGIAAARKKRGLMPVSQEQKFQRGLELQKQINQRNFAPQGGAGPQPSKLGTMGESTLQVPQKATGQPLGGVQFTNLQPRGLTPVAGAKTEPAAPAPSGAQVEPAAPANAGGNLLPPPQLGASSPDMNYPGPPMPDQGPKMAMESQQGDDMEALNQYADQELGGVDWEQRVNGRKRGLRAMSGPYAGMTPEMARNAVQNKFRGLRPDQKEAMSQRGRGLSYRPQQGDDMEALNQYADQELGGGQTLLWRVPKRGDLRIRGGAYDGMTHQQAMMHAVQNKFRGLRPDQKEAMSQRGRGLTYRPQQ